MVREVSGLEIELKFLINLLLKCANPRKCCTSLIEVGCGQSSTALVLLGSISKLPLETMNPGKETEKT